MINSLITNKAIPIRRKTSVLKQMAKASCFLIAAAFLNLFVFSENAYNDMGMIHASNAKVSEESQKAIIFYNNNNDEALILGTDLKATRKTGVIRFIPFPSEPAVSLAPNDSFETINTLIKAHELKFLSRSKGGPTAAQGAVELRFNERLGAHDIAVIKVNDASGFREWVNGFFKKKGLPQKSKYPDIERIVDDYLKRGIAWFVFDFVELTEKTKFIEPVKYRFRTKELYYPLKTSNTVGGTGRIDLVLITPATLGDPFERPGSGLGISSMRASTSSQIEQTELSKLLPEAAAFFADRKLFIQLFTYWGEYEFEKDIFADISKGVPNAVDNERWWPTWPSFQKTPIRRRNP